MASESDQSFMTDGSDLRDAGMAAAAGNPDNAMAVAIAGQCLEELIKTRRLFTSSDVITMATAKGANPETWRCIGSMIRCAAQQGRITLASIGKSSRRSRRCGDQKTWQSLECA